jgi:hypothetical protein
VVRDHLTGKRNYTLSINKLLTMELLHRLFIDTQSRTSEAITATVGDTLQPQV